MFERETDEWLAVAGPGEGPGQEDRPRAVPARRSAASHRSKPSATVREPRMPSLAARLARVERELNRGSEPSGGADADLSRRLAALERTTHDRLDRVEASLRALSEREPRREGVRRQLEPARRRPAGSRNGSAAAAQADGASRRRADWELNHVDYEQLRAIGLSVTESARLIAIRETRGGFSSAEELATLEGFDSASLAALLERVRV